MLALDLKGKHAVVTGGSRGVGRAVALLLAQAGAHVGISYFNRKADADAVVAQLAASGANAWAERGDLARRDDADALFERARKEFGSLDIFVGNAGRPVWREDDRRICPGVSRDGAWPPCR